MVPKTGNSNIGPPKSTSTDTRPKMKEICQKWFREELKEIFYCFYYALKNPLETCTTGKMYRLWQVRNKTERLNIDANKLANVRRDVMK